MIHRIYDIVKRKLIRGKRKEHCAARPLCIKGCKTRMTPEPDDSELAALALLETLSGGNSEVSGPSAGEEKEPERGSAEYYRALSGRIRQAHAQEARRAKRYLSYAEEQMGNPLSVGDLAELERGLYPLQDSIEREGGELKRRWQHCLAEIIVRQMSEANNSDNGDEIFG